MTAVSEQTEVDLASLVHEHQADIWRYLRYLAALADCLKHVKGRAREVLDRLYRDAQSRIEIAKNMKMKTEGVKTLLRRTRGVLRCCRSEFWYAATWLGVSRERDLRRRIRNRQRRGRPRSARSSGRVSGASRESQGIHQRVIAIHLS